MAEKSFHSYALKCNILKKVLFFKSKPLYSLHMFLFNFQLLWFVCFGSYSSWWWDFSRLLVQNHFQYFFLFWIIPTVLRWDPNLILRAPSWWYSGITRGNYVLLGVYTRLFGYKACIQSNYLPLWPFSVSL